MREIGGYLELENYAGCEYYKNSIALNTARNALVFLAREKKISKVFLPYFLCDSVYKVCEREKIDYTFYHIDKDFMPVFSKALNKDEYLYIVNYYGQIDHQKINKLKNLYERIIIDNVQAFFDIPASGVDTIYSCRKFFGVPDGAYLVSDVKHQPELQADISKDRLTHIVGRYEEECASEYYAKFQENDNLFEELPCRYMSKLTHNMLRAIDYDKVIQKRNENWNYLNRELSESNMLNLNKPTGPYMYPYYCKNGYEVRKKLIEKKIFIPTLWPNVMNFQNCSLEKDYAENILPLPIDQRYSEKDMTVITNEIKNI